MPSDSATIVEGVRARTAIAHLQACTPVVCMLNRIAISQVGAQAHIFIHLLAGISQLLSSQNAESKGTSQSISNQSKQNIVQNVTFTSLSSVHVLPVVVRCKLCRVLSGRAKSCPKSDVTSLSSMHVLRVVKRYCTGCTGRSKVAQNAMCSLHSMH